jgi:hypothetical protein
MGGLGIAGGAGAGGEPNTGAAGDASGGAQASAAGDMQGASGTIQPPTDIHTAMPPPAAPVATWLPKQLARARSILTSAVASAIERLPPEQQALLLTMPCGSLPWGTQEFGLADVEVLQALEGLPGG